MKHRGTVLSLIGLALTFAVTAASAQTYTVLHTYPVGSGAYSGITFPQVHVARPRRQPVRQRLE